MAEEEILAIILYPRVQLIKTNVQDAESLTDLAYKVPNENEKVKSLKDLANKEKQLFWKCREDKDKTAYAPSSLYITILRGYVEGIRLSHIEDITLSLELDDIYLVLKFPETNTVKGKGKQNFKSLEAWEADKRQEPFVHCLLTKFKKFTKAPMTANKFDLLNYGDSAADLGNSKDSDWTAMADSIKELNRLLGISKHTKSFLSYQLTSFLDELKKDPEETFKARIDEIHHHPIFWGSHKSAIFLSTMGDFLSHAKFEMVIRSMQTDLRAQLDLKSWEKIFDEDTNLAKLRAANADYKAEREKKTAAQFNVTSNIVEGDIKQLITVMRNILVHFHSLRQDVLDPRKKKRDILEISDSEQLMDLYAQRFPFFNCFFARQVAVHETTLGKQSKRVTGIWPSLSGETREF